MTRALPMVSLLPYLQHRYHRKLTRGSQPLSQAAPNVAALICYFRALPLPERWKGQLDRVEVVKKLLKIFTRRYQVYGYAFANGMPGENRPVVWNGQVGLWSCLADYDTRHQWPGGYLCPELSNNLMDSPERWDMMNVGCGPTVSRRDEGDYDEGGAQACSLPKVDKKNGEAGEGNGEDQSEKKAPVVILPTANSGPRTEIPPSASPSTSTSPSTSASSSASPAFPSPSKPADICDSACQREKDRERAKKAEEEKKKQEEKKKHEEEQKKKEEEENKQEQRDKENLHNGNACGCTESTCLDSAPSCCAVGCPECACDVFGQNCKNAFNPDTNTGYKCCATGTCQWACREGLSDDDRSRRGCNKREKPAEECACDVFGEDCKGTAACCAAGTCHGACSDGMSDDDRSRAGCNKREKPPMQFGGGV